jgi:hypothetical protein
MTSLSSNRLRGDLQHPYAEHKGVAQGARKIVQLRTPDIKPD